MDKENMMPTKNVQPCKRDVARQHYGNERCQAKKDKDNNYILMIKTNRKRKEVVFMKF